MIIRFSTRFDQITMFGEAALMLLQLAGHSGAVPGAILQADLPAYLQRLRQGLEQHGDTLSPPPRNPALPPDPVAEEQERRAPITLRTRALPLLQMMEAAAHGGSDLMWDRL